MILVKYWKKQNTKTYGDDMQYENMLKNLQCVQKENTKFFPCMYSNMKERSRMICF